MPVKNPPDEQPPSDAERAILSRMARDHEREDWLRERTEKRSKARWEAVRSWTALFGAIVAVKGVLWEPLKDIAAWFMSHVK